MDFGLSEEQELLQTTAREVLSHECPAAFVREIAAQTDGFSRRLHEKMAELGWAGLGIPEAHGGLGLGTLDMMLILEELGRAAAPGPYPWSSYLVPLALRSAAAPLRRRWLGEIASGRALGTTALLEESDRIDAGGVTARARLQRDGYILNGVKMFVPYAAVADFVLTPFRTAGKGARGVTLFLVPLDAPGLEIRLLESFDATRRVYELHFEKVHVPRSSVLGRPGEGWAMVERLHDAGALAIAADSLGGAERCLEMSVEYSKVREQFGRPVGSFQAVKHMAAEMFAEIEPCRSLLWYASHLFSTAPKQAARAIAMAKARLSDVYSLVADGAVQMHGGIGFTWEHDLHFWYKRAIANRAAFGDPSHHRERVAALSGFERS